MLARLLKGGFLLVILLSVAEAQSTEVRPPSPRTAWDRVFFHAQADRGEVDFAKAQSAMAATKGRSLDHIGFEVKNLEDFCKKLQAEGVTFDTTFRVIPQLEGLKIAYVLDPAGTRIELTEGFAAQSMAP